MELEGAPLADGTDVSMRLWVQGPHGGLTVVHGGGNMRLETAGEMDRMSQNGDNILTRLDGLDWAADGYEVGQRVQVGGEADTRLILGIADADGSLRPADAFGTWGTGSALILSGPAFTGGPEALTVHVANPFRTEVTEAVDIWGDALTRSGGDWADAGFYVGQTVRVEGAAGSFTVASLSGAKMTVQEPDLLPRKGGVLTVYGFDPDRDGGVRIGGDHIIVTGGGGPDSPLVVYGDTSQDGVLYGGHPYDALGMEFGEKPFDPFPNLPDGDNEDDEWVFPLANPFTYAGNDVIDAGALFADLDAADLPTVGLTIYGGAGNDRIIGSQAGDHLAGGSGDDLIYGQRGVDHIYGDSGVNVNLFTRTLTIDTADHSPEPTVDDGAASNGAVIQPSPSPVRDDLTAGRDEIWGEGPGSAPGGPGVDVDLIFGDHGVIAQDVTDPHLPPAPLQKIQTTSLSSLLHMISVEPVNGDDDVIYGGVDNDVMMGGPGDDALDAGTGNNSEDVAIGDSGRMTFNGTEAYDPGEAASILSFNFTGGSHGGCCHGSLSLVTGAAGADEARAENWNNLSGGGRIYGDEAGELLYYDDGLIAPGITVAWGRDLDAEYPGRLYEDSHSQIEPGDDPDLNLFDGYLYTGVSHTLGVDIDGLAGRYREYDVYVYLDADDWTSRRDDSVRSITAGGTTFYLNDPDGNTYAGEYVLASSIDPAAPDVGNYVVFRGLTADDVSIRVEDVGDGWKYWYNKPAISGIQVVGRHHPIDRVETIHPDFGGNDALYTGGGPDLAYGGAGNDHIETFGNPIYGEIDADAVAGDNARATLMLGELRDIRTTAPESENRDTDQDVILTGNGEDLVFGGNGGDAVDTGVKGAFDYGDVQILSLNFNSNVAEGEVDGIAGGVAAGHWNNLGAHSHGPHHWGGHGHHHGGGHPDPDPLIFDSGAEAAGVSVEWGCDSGSCRHDGATPDTQGQIDPDTQNERLFEGYLTAGPRKTLEVEIAGLSAHYDRYDVYVYLDADNGNSLSEASVRSITDGNTVFYLNDADGNTFKGQFVEATSTDPAAPGTGNYVVFRNLTGDAVSLRIEGEKAHKGGWNNRPSIAAVQIVGGADKDAVVIAGDYDRDAVLGDNGVGRIYAGEVYELIATDPANGGHPFQSDAIAAGDGADLVIGGNGGDWIRGQSGDDLIIGDNARVILFNGQVPGLTEGGIQGWSCDACWHGGFDPYDVAGVQLLADDVGGNDRMAGGRDNDLIYGQFGNDTYAFYGGGLGYDLLVEAGDPGDGHDHCGGCSGSDLDPGGRPNDLRDHLDFTHFIGPVDVDLSRPDWQTINGGYRHTDFNLAVKLFSGTAFEDVTGSAFDDHIDGNNRDNTLIGLGGDDAIRGETGDDALFGSDGDDWLVGGRGDDAIDGGAGDDGIRGDAGDDLLFGNDGDDVIYGGDGDDRIGGGAGDDALKGESGDDLLFGHDGDDYIVGGSGNDRIDGGAGDDALKGECGDDVLLGGDGDDYAVGGGGDDQIDGGAGDDAIRGDSGDDVLLGGDGDDYLNGGAGEDRMDGGAGDDALKGESGDDLLLGGDGDDYLNGGSGHDLLNGGAGDDGLKGQSGDDVLLGGDGDDYLVGGGGDDLMDGGAGNDALFGGGKDKGHCGWGGCGRSGREMNVMLGGDGDDYMVGADGRDLMAGEAGDDRIDGERGDDIVLGGEGRDKVSGGRGHDVVKGGPGKDQVDDGRHGRWGCRHGGHGHHADKPLGLLRFFQAFDAAVGRDGFFFTDPGAGNEQPARPWVQPYIDSAAAETVEAPEPTTEQVGPIAMDPIPETWAETEYGADGPAAGRPWLVDFLTDEDDGDPNGDIQLTV
jgi:Ca2+-binding RTX toxin-like protein